MTDTRDQESRSSNGSADGQTPAPDIEPAAPVTPEERVAALELERDELKDRMLRIAADFENWKKRARKEQTDGEARVRESVLKDMLDIVDNLERATSAYAHVAAGAGAENGKHDGKNDAKIDGAAILKGVGLVLRLFQSKLERYEVRPFEAKGQPFDPRLHEAISQVATNEVAPGAVASDLQKGYRIGDKLLRPAAVAVAVAPKGEGAA
jgi:molecular chaperone GrpE